MGSTKLLFLLLPSSLLLLLLLTHTVTAASTTNDITTFSGFLEGLQDWFTPLLSGKILSIDDIKAHVQSPLFSSLFNYAINYAMFLGGGIVKVPQLLNVISSKSVAGLSLYGIYAELLGGAMYILYNFHKHAPIKTYGEVCLIFPQNLCLLFLIWTWAKPPTPPLHRYPPFLLICALAYTGWILPEHSEIMAQLQFPLLVFMRGPQIYTNYILGHTGQLSWVTVLLSAVGGAVRIWTNYKHHGMEDTQTKLSIFNVSLWVVIVVQMVVYREATVRANKGGRGKVKKEVAPPTRRSSRVSKTKKA